MAHIRRTKQGRWQANVRVRDGKVSKTFDTIKEAEEWAKDIRRYGLPTPKVKKDTDNNPQSRQPGG